MPELAPDQLGDAREREAVLQSVANQSFDLVVIGGGINGAGVLNDATQRGLKVLLLEKEDLAFGTSSRSSKLIHGGLRYLEHYQFKLVFEGTNERAALRRIAPHLVRPLMFALPVYEGDRHPLWMVDVGLWMYDTLSLFKVEKRHITLRSQKRMLAREPMLRPDKLNGGIIYYDCMTDDARLTLENVLIGLGQGGVALTQTKVVAVDAQEDKPEARVEFRDRLSDRAYAVRAKAVVNCTGPWTDSVRAHAGDHEPVIRPTKGVHIVVPHTRLPVQHAAALMAPQDGRVFFVIPWRGRTVIGTTDTDYPGDRDHIATEVADVAYLLEAANHFYPEAQLMPEDVWSSWAGLRPLIRPPETASTAEVPREHKLFVDGRMVSVAGGKLTTYRRMAEEIVDEAAQLAGLDVPPSRTAKTRLPGAEGLEQAEESLVEAGVALGLEQASAEHLVAVYGVRAEGLHALIQTEPELAQLLCPECPHVWAEVVFAVREELALKVEDVLVRRTSLSLLAEDQALEVAPQVAERMGAELGWSSERVAQEVQAYGAAVGLTRDAFLSMR